MSKPILCLDFDGVCHSFTSGWQGMDVILDEPVPGLWDFLLLACDKFDVQVFSSRSEQASGILAMIAWFGKHTPFSRPTTYSKSHISWYGGTVSISFPTSKPPAFLTIDDRAITFTGQWPEVEQLLQFKPWNKRN